MSCEDARHLLMDIVYGEDVSMGDSARFFDHLDDCRPCSLEYRELMDTRELLADWQLDDDSLPTPTLQAAKGRPARRGWELLARAAAVFLVAMGAVSMLQEVGLWPDRHVVVSEPELAEMVHDMILAGQEENWRVIGRALLAAREELETEQRVQLQLISREVEGLEVRFVDALEENTRQFRTMMASQE